MKLSKMATKNMFDYESLGSERSIKLTSELPLKVRRSIVFSHRDKRIRVLLLRESGIEIGDEIVANHGVTMSDNCKQLLIIGARVSVEPNVNFIYISCPNNSKLLADDFVFIRYVRGKNYHRGRCMDGS